MRAHERKLRDHEASMEAFAKVIAMPAKPARARQISFMAPQRGLERRGGVGNGGGNSNENGNGNGSPNGNGNENGNGLLMTPPRPPAAFPG